jgi:glycosyltransferase involved in cell wall biosynthesis
VKNEVIILGYDPARIAGGIASVTDVLLKGLPNVRLLPLKHCYGVLDVCLYFRSLVKFAAVARQRPVTHLIVGSKGDRLRAIPVLIMAALLKFPLCIQYHKQLDGLLSGIWFLDQIIDAIFRVCSCHVFLSERLRREFLDRHPDCDFSVTKVIGNALPNEWMDLPTPSRNERPVDIVFCGRWNKEKGIELLVEYLLRSRERVACEIYTDHPHQLSIPGTVVKSWATADELRAAMSRARLVVLPSNREGYPTVLLESMACGTPFVASAITGIVDIAIESRGGMVFPAGDILGFSVAINSILRHSHIWGRCSKRGHSWVNWQCRTDTVLRKWASLYDQLKATRP